MDKLYIVNRLLNALADTNDKPEISVIDKLIPNVWAFIAQLLAFIVLIVCVFFFAYKPVSKFIKKRKEYVQSNITQAEELNKQAKENKEKSEEELKQTSIKAQDIYKENIEAIEKERTLKLSQLKKEIELKKQKELKQIEIEKQQAIKESKEEIVNIAFEASKQLLQREINEKDDKKLLSNFVDEIIQSKSEEDTKDK